MKETTQPEQPRITVSRIKDPKTGKFWLRGTEIADYNRANVFGKWCEWEDDDPLRREFDGDGHYMVARASSCIGVEVEVRFDFYEPGDGKSQQPLEAYTWEVYRWKLTPRGLICEKDQAEWGDYFFGHGPLYRHINFTRLIAEGATRIHHARFGDVEFETRVVGRG